MTSPRPSRTTRLKRALCAALLCAAAPAFAQDAPRPPVDPRVQHLLQSRGRERLHPGNPLELVGTEQAGNDLRSRTPALQQSDAKARQLDLDDVYERALAMYDGGARYSSPPLAASNAPAGHKKARKRANTNEEEAPPSSGVGRLIGGGLLLGTLLVIATLLRSRWIESPT